MSCPPDEVFVDLLEGKTGSLELHQHLDGCRPCQKLVAAFARSAGAGDNGKSGEPRAGDRVSQYVVEALLGRGAMGVVFRAHDTRLDRRVALKFLLAERALDPHAQERFIREARAASALNHPHVGAVFEIGEHQGTPFIAMALHDGESLRDRLARAPLPLGEAATLIAQMAAGLAAAHAAGVVHRDVKPGNVMLTASGVKLVDFGLAKLPPGASASLTETGETLGTLTYMAPEQHLALEVDARADVWSLGVVAYEVLGGRLPFAASSTAKLVEAVLRDEPRPLPEAIPRDLGTVVWKCLEKSPARRYPSAQPLAEDLERFRSGRPIFARPIGLWGRARRWARRHAASAAGLAAVLALVALGGYSWMTRRNAFMRAERAQALGRRVEKTRDLMRKAFLMPEHDTHREREQVRTGLQSIEKEMGALGREGLAPGEFALGSGWLALGQFERARPHLEAAWNAGERGADISYDLGSTLGLAYQRALKELPAGDDKTREKSELALQHQLRDPALGYLRSAGGAADTSPEYLEALIAFYERRWNDARSRAHQAFAQNPFWYEAGALEASALNRLAQERWRAGDLDAAAAMFAEQVRDFDRVAEIARSDDRPLHSAVDALLAQATFFAQRGQPYRPVLERAIMLSRRALAVNSEDATPLAMEAYAHWELGEDDALLGDDPRPQLDQAIALSEQALARQPELWQALGSLGNAWEAKADLYETKHGIDPRPSIEHAIKAFERSLGAHPDGDDYVSLASAYAVRGGWERMHGIDPRPSTDAALAANRHALAIREDELFAHCDQCLELADTRAQWTLDHGGDPRADLDAAAAECDRAEVLDPQAPEERVAASTVAWLRARWAESQDADPEPELARADKEAERAVMLNDKRPVYGAWLARMRGEHAAWWVRTGRDPARLLEGARRAVGKALAAEPRSLDAATSQAYLELVAARWAIRQGVRPIAALDQVAAAVARALAVDAADPDALALGAEGRLVLAGWLAAHKKDARPEIDAGLTFAKRALAQDSTRARVFAVRGRLLRLRGAGADAEGALAAAFRINPALRREFE